MINYGIEVYNIIEKYLIIFNNELSDDQWLNIRNETNDVDNDTYNRLKNEYIVNIYDNIKINDIAQAHLNYLNDFSSKFTSKLNTSFAIIRQDEVDLLIDLILKNKECLVSKNKGNLKANEILNEKGYLYKYTNQTWENKKIYNQVLNENILAVKGKLNEKLNSSSISAYDIKLIIDINIINPEEYKEKVCFEIIQWFNDNEFKPQLHSIGSNSYESLTSTSWIKQKKYSPEEIINPQLANFIKIADKALINEEVDIALENYQKALKINPSNTYVLGQINKINTVIKTHLERLKFEIQQDLLELYNSNKPNKLTFKQLFVYYEFAKEHRPLPQPDVEIEINKFINNNNLVPENKLLPNTINYTAHVSNNWIKKQNTLLKFFFDNISILKQILFFLAISICIGLAFKYFYNTGITYHTIAFDGANIRSSPDIGSDANIKEKIVYGQTFKINKEMDVVQGFGGLWLKNDGVFSDKYVSSKIFVNEKDFYLLESIFGDEITKQTIKTVKCRKALIDYYKRQDPEYKYFGKIDEKTYKKVFGKTKDFTDEYQVFCTDFIERVPNSIIYPRVFYSKSKYTDFGFIVTNVSANIKRFVLYTFDGITEDPIYLGEVDANGHKLVKSVTIRSNGTLNVIFAD